MLARYIGKLPYLTLREIHRFVNCLQNRRVLTRDIDGLEKDIRLGLKKSAMKAFLSTASGIGTGASIMSCWINKVSDVGLPDVYRDNRTTGIMPQALVPESAKRNLSPQRVQFLPFSTIYQLRADET